MNKLKSLQQSQQIHSAIEHWYQRPFGQMIAALQYKQMQSILPRIFGNVVVQLGGPVAPLFVEQAQVHTPLYMNHRLLSNVSVQQVVTDFAQLPLLPNSTDAAIVVHVLEALAEPKLCLQQIHQALKPNGLLIVFGFNRWHCWRLLGLEQPIANANYLSAGLVRRWLRMLDLTVVSTKTLGFRPSFLSASVAKRLVFFEAVGQLSLNGMGAVYMIVARKNVLARHKMPTRWSWRRRWNVKGAVEPTTRNPYFREV